MKNLHLSFVVAIFLLLGSSCTSTRIVSSWKDPDKKIHAADWKKVLVVALLRNETDRRSTENEMVKYLQGKGVTSYTYLGENFNMNDEEALRNKMKNDGFDAAVTMRLIDVDKEKIFVPQQNHIYPVYYDHFSKYLHRNWWFYNVPGYYTVTEKFIIETVIYSIPDDTIIWSGITETYDPGGVKRLTDDIAHTIRKRMQYEGFIEE